MKAMRMLLVPVLLLVFQACKDSCKVTNTYIYYRPVYSTSAEVKGSVVYEAPRKLSNLGKIYFKDGYVFINQVGEGIHVLDNRNPSSPVQIGFLKIPGNNDLAMIGDVLYADSYVDLIVFDASDKSAIKEINRVERVFNHLQVYGFSLSDKDLVLTDWEEVKAVSVYESSCESQIQPWGGLLYADGIAFSSTAQNSSTTPAPTSSTGIGGSMAKFTITQNHLYALDGGWMDVIDLKDPAHPGIGKEIEVGWDMETLFPYKDKLFAGSRSGMFIYSLQTPDQPQYVSKYTHVVSCDPVVVDDNYAYVTLRTGTNCRATGINQLEVVSIANLSNPTLVSTVQLSNPRGLGLDGKTLFICDGDAGLKVFDVTDVNSIDKHLITSYPGIKTLDIIPYRNIAMMIGEDGLYQYDYSNLQNIHSISKLPIYH